MTHVAMAAGTYRPERDGVAHYVVRMREALARRGVPSSVLTPLGERPAKRTTTGLEAPWTAGDRRACRRSSGVSGERCAGEPGWSTFSTPAPTASNAPSFSCPPLLRAVGIRIPIVTTVHEYAWWKWEPRGILPALVEAAKTWGQRRGLWDREDGFLLTGSDGLITTNAPTENAIQEVQNLSWSAAAECHEEVYEQVLKGREKGRLASWRR